MVQALHPIPFRFVSLIPALVCGLVRCNRSSLRLQYLPALRQTLTQPLLAGEKDGIQPVVEDLNSYALNKVIAVIKAHRAGTIATALILEPTHTPLSALGWTIFHGYAFEGTLGVSFLPIPYKTQERIWLTACIAYTRL